MGDLDQVVQTLERTPGVLRSLLDDVPGDAARSNYGPGTWSAYEVVGHLIVGEREDWIPRVQIIIDAGTSRPFDPFPHDATIRPESGRSLHDLLDEFEQLRRKSLDTLRAMHIASKHLGLTGTHPAFGEVTLGELLSTWAAHDLHHIRQACLALAWRFRDDVGPWRNYINTLAPRA